MSLKTLVQKAELAINGQDWEVAVELADEILLLAPENEDAMLIKAEALTHLDRVMESDILLDRVLERNPRCVMAYVLSVFNSMAVMDLQEALRFANKGLGIDPEDFDLVMSKAQLLYWLGDPEYKSWIEEARRINRDRTDDFMAFHWIEEVPPTHPASVTVNLLPQITDAMEEGHYEKAIRLIKDALGSSMEGLHDPRGLREVLRGLEVECHLCLGNMKKARKKVKKLLRANPKNPHAWYYKARLSFHSGNIQAALEETDQSIKVAEEEGLRHPDYYFMKAYLLEEMGDPEAAQRFIELGEEVGAENKEKFEKMLEGVPILGNAPTWDEIRVALMRFMMDNYPPEEFWDAVREGYPYEDDVFDEEGRALDKLDWFLYEYVRPETGRTPVREFAEKYGPPLRERILQMEDITHGRFEVVGAADSGDVIPGVVRLKGPGGRLYDTLIPEGWDPKRGQVVVGRLHPWDRVYRFCGMLSVLSTFPDLLVDVPSPEELIAQFDERAIKEAEEIPLWEKSTLKHVLDKYPFQWVDGMTAALGFQVAGRKREKVKRIVAALNSERLFEIVENLPGRAKEALDFVISKGGRVKYGQLSRRYDDEIGFWWNEEPPQSPVGLLRLHGLLVVGKMNIKGRNYRVAVVPQEIQTRLERAQEKGRWG